MQVLLFYRTGKRPFYAVPEMSFWLKLQPDARKAPVERALRFWSQSPEFKFQPGLVGYICKLCRSLLLDVDPVCHRDLFSFVDRETRCVRIFMSTDTWQVDVLLGEKWREIAPEASVRPDMELLAESCVL